MSIRSAYKYTHRTTLRIDTDLWKRFKNHCKFHGLTTCFVMRALMQEWLSRETYRNHKTKVGRAEWWYSKDSMTLYKKLEYGRFREKIPQEPQKVGWWIIGQIAGQPIDSPNNPQHEEQQPNL